MTTSFSVIEYPNNIKCECGKKVEPKGKYIDCGTWNLICDCGKIAYLHPKRFERSKQLDAMLDIWD